MFPNVSRILFIDFPLQYYEFKIKSAYIKPIRGMKSPRAEMLKPLMKADDFCIFFIMQELSVFLHDEGDFICLSVLP